MIDYPAFLATAPGDLPCADDPELFRSRRAADVAEAKKICQPCPVRPACAEWALEHDEPGTWGATTAAERAAMRRRASAEEEPEGTAVRALEPPPGAGGTDGTPGALFGLEIAA